MNRAPSWAPAPRAHEGSTPSPRNPLLPAAPAPSAAPEPPVEHSELLGPAISVTRGPTQPVGLDPNGHGRPGLGFAAVRADPPVWIVGLHGGCGASTVTTLLGQGAELRGAWPRPAVTGLAVPRVMLVARTHARGLDAAAAAAGQWATNTTGVLLVGLVLVNDAPTVPRPLSEMAQQLAGMLPAMWHLGWLEPLRLASATPAAGELPRRVRKTMTSIGGHVAAARAAGTLGQPAPPSRAPSSDPSAWATRARPNHGTVTRKDS